MIERGQARRVPATREGNLGIAADEAREKDAGQNHCLR
jgi:hypothetical protein